MADQAHGNNQSSSTSFMPPDSVSTPQNGTTSWGFSGSGSFGSSASHVDSDAISGQQPNTTTSSGPSTNTSSSSLFGGSSGTSRLFAGHSFGSFASQESSCGSGGFGGFGGSAARQRPDLLISRLNLSSSNSRTPRFVVGNDAVAFSMRISDPSNPFMPDKRRYGEDEKRVRDTDFPPGFGRLSEKRKTLSYEEWRLGQMHEFALWSSQKENPIAALCDDEIIEVIVGETANCRRLHRKLLCDKSQFFMLALKPKSLFREAQERKVTLKEDDSLIFGLFVQWLYTGTFACNSLDTLIHAYILGDKLRVRDFGQSAFIKIHALNSQECQFTPKQAALMSEKLRPSSALRMFTMDMIAFALLKGTLKPTEDDWILLVPVSVEILCSVQGIVQLQEECTWKNMHEQDYYLVFI